MRNWYSQGDSSSAFLSAGVDAVEEEYCEDKNHHLETTNVVTEA